MTQVVLADRSHISAFVLKPDPFSRPYPRHNWNTIERKREIWKILRKGNVLNISWFQLLLFPAKSSTMQLKVRILVLIADCPLGIERYEFCKDQWCQKLIRINDEKVICSFLSMVVDVMRVQKGRWCRVVPQTSFSFGTDQVSFVPDTGWFFGPWNWRKKGPGTPCGSLVCCTSDQF